MPVRISLRTFLFLSIVAVMTSCGKNKSSQNQGEKLRVLSSFSIITDMVQEIGKDSVLVHNIVPVGTDPHNYAPNPKDVKFASTADLIIYNGLHLEGGESGWLMKLAHSIEMDGHRIFKAAKNIPPKYLKDENGKKEVNPHAFISPVAGISMAKAIRDALMAIDPDNKTFYKKNAHEYIQRIKTIDREYRQKFSDIPKERRIFVASEQAFQYFVDEYGLKEGHIWAIDTDKNGTPNQIKNAISFIKNNQPPVLFVESNVDRRPMEKVSEATGVPIFNKPIFSDELGKPGEPADTYIKYLNYNLEVIFKGLK